MRILGRPGAERVEDPWELLDQVADERSAGAGAAVIGTPDDLIAAIRHLQRGHRRLRRRARLRPRLGQPRGDAPLSWDLVARYVIPEINGTLRPLQASADTSTSNKAELMAGASAAVMEKILANPRAADAMAVTMQQLAARRASRAGVRRGGARRGRDVTRDLSRPAGPPRSV